VPIEHQLGSFEQRYEATLHKDWNALEIDEPHLALRFLGGFERAVMSPTTTPHLALA
jgi:hypothetical protein